MTDDLPQLVQRLTDLAARYDMSHTERYEVDSEAFYAETGYIAPGKDVPMAMGGQNEAERRAAHEAWITARNRQQQQTLRDAATALDTLTRALAESQREAEAVALLRARIDRENADFYAAVSNRADKAESALTAMTQERDEALELSERQRVALVQYGMEHEEDIVRLVAEQDAAVREARAETWEEAALLAGQSATAIRHMRQAFVASPVMGELAVVRAEALEQFAKGLHERATAARMGQP